MDHSKFRENVEANVLTPAGVSQYVFLYVSTRDERKRLSEAGIFSAVEILKGKLNGEQKRVTGPITEEWNRRLGFECF